MTYIFANESDLITRITSYFPDFSIPSTTCLLIIHLGIYLWIAVLASAALGYNEILHRQAIIKAKDKQLPEIKFAELPVDIQFEANQEQLPSSSAKDKAMKRKETAVANLRPMKRVQLEATVQKPIYGEQRPLGLIKEMDDIFEVNPASERARCTVQSWTEIVDSLGSMDFD